MKLKVTLDDIESLFSHLSVEPSVHMLGLLPPRRVMAGLWPPDPGRNSIPGKCDHPPPGTTGAQTAESSEIIVIPVHSSQRPGKAQMSAEG